MWKVSPVGGGDFREKRAAAQIRGKKFFLTAEKPNPVPCGAGLPVSWEGGLPEIKGVLKKELTRRDFWKAQPGRKKRYRLNHNKRPNPLPPTKKNASCFEASLTKVQVLGGRGGNVTRALGNAGKKSGFPDGPRERAFSDHRKPGNDLPPGGEGKKKSGGGPSGKNPRGNPGC